MWLSFGPMPSAGDGRASGFGIYGVLYDYVPGFNGVRVPARYAMIAGMFLAVLAGYGANAMCSWRRLRVLPPALCLLLLSAAVLVEGAAIPMEINRTWSVNQATPPARVYPASNPGVPPVYARLAALPEGSVITEFPFGDMAWEIRYVYYSAVHRKPITNGYSGAFPPRYKERLARLQRVAANPEAAWQALRELRHHARRVPPQCLRQGGRGRRGRGVADRHGAKRTASVSRMAISCLLYEKRSARIPVNRTGVAEAAGPVSEAACPRRQA